MKNMTTKSAALELALMILQSTIPGEAASKAMEQMGKIAHHPDAQPLAKENFDKANSIYQSLDPSKAQHIMIVDDPEDLAKFRAFRDYLLAISDHIAEYKYLVTVDGWDRSRDFKILINGNLGFQVTTCGSGTTCGGCLRRVEAIELANKAAGGVLAFFKSGGDTWVNLPDPKVGNLTEYLERTLGIKITRLHKV